MFLLSPQNNFYIIYIEFIRRIACEKNSSEKISKIHVFVSFPGIQNLNGFFRKFTLNQVLKSY